MLNKRYYDSLCMYMYLLYMHNYVHVFDLLFTARFCDYLDWYRPLDLRKNWCSNLLRWHVKLKLHIWTFLLQLQPGNMQSMLSRPDNADISQYQQYRQGYAAKYSAGADGKLEKQKSSPGAPSAGEQAGMETSPNDKVYIILCLLCRLQEVD